VNALEKAGHTVSVIVPNTQRSWIGKAHLVGQDIQTTFYWPPSTNPDEHTEGYTEKENGSHPWVLVNSTPASCSQLGLNCFFQERGPVDLVISGPNYGRNTTSLFALSSGTMGAALEATQCGYRSIALSFAFTDRTNPPDVVAESCEQSVRVCEWLAANGKWGDSRLYSVNVPVKKGVLQSKISWTKMLQNTWGKGACFQEISREGAVDDASTEEAKLRKEESRVEGGSESGTATPNGKWAHRHFKWAPRFTDVMESVKKAGPGYDGWAVMEGETSVTSLRANFENAGGFEGELKL
jgi:tubulin--tyrosine ligase